MAHLGVKSAFVLFLPVVLSLFNLPLETDVQSLTLTPN